MSDHHEQTVPRAALIGAGVLILMSLGLAASARASHLADREPAPVASRDAIDIRFEDRPDGTLAVLDATSGAEVAKVPPGTNGFVRGVLRGMFRGRKLESMSRAPGFRLARETSGRLTLVDPETQRRVDLESFGATNAAAFNAILAAGLRAR